MKLGLGDVKSPTSSCPPVSTRGGTCSHIRDAWSVFVNDLRGVSVDRREERLRRRKTSAVSGTG